MTLFLNDQASHEHSLQTLKLISQYESYLHNVKTIYDMGCGSGEDAKWWANLHYVSGQTGKLLPFNFNVVGIDLQKQTHRDIPNNLQFIQYDFEEYDISMRSDMIWSHDSFRYAVNPLKTLRNWWKILNPNGMLCIITPQTTNHIHGKSVIRGYSNNFYHYTIVNLIYMLAVSGFDLRDNRFWKESNDPWLHLIAYKGENTPLEDPRGITWYDLLDKNCLPERWIPEIKKSGYLKQEVLRTHWINGQFCFWDKL